MSMIFAGALALAVAAIVAWNAWPAFRRRVRGWSTALEAVIIGGMPFLGDAIDAFRGTDWKAYVPQQAWQYILAGLAAWIIYKRVTTHTPFGHKD